MVGPNYFCVVGVQLIFAEVFAGHVGTHMWNVPFSYIISERWLIVGAPPSVI